MTFEHTLTEITRVCGLLWPGVPMTPRLNPKNFFMGEQSTAGWQVDIEGLPDYAFKYLADPYELAEDAARDTLYQLCEMSRDRLKKAQESVASLPELEPVSADMASGFNDVPYVRRRHWR